MERNTWRVLGITFLISATLLRLETLDAPFSSREALTLEMATQGVPALLRSLGERLPYPPAYFLALHGWTEVFGTSEVAVRSLSLLFAVLAGFLLLAWLRSAYGGWTAAMTMLMVGMSTFHVHMSMEAQPYSMFSFLMVAWLWLYYRFCQDPTGAWRRILPLAGVQALMVATDFHSAILLTLSGLHLFLFDRRTPTQTRRFAFAASVTLVFSAAWFPVFLAHIQTPSVLFEPTETDAWKRALLALGPAPAHVSGLVAWGSALSCLALGGYAVAHRAWASVKNASNALAPGAIELPPWRSAIATGLTVAALAGPMLTYLLAPWSAGFREALDSQLLRAVALAGLFQFALLFLVFLNANRITRRIDVPLEDLVAVGLAVYYCVVYAFDVSHDFTKLSFAIPLFLLLAVRAYVPTKLSTALAILALVVATAAPSLLMGRTHFLPTPDFRTIARSIQLAPERSGRTWNFILPMWDERGLEYYLGPGTVTGILAVEHIGPVERLPERINLVMTRKDYEDRGVHIAAAARYLGPAFIQSGVRAGDNIFMVSFERVRMTGARLASVP